MEIKIVDPVGNEISEPRSNEHHQPGSIGGEVGEIERIAIAQVLDMDLKDISKNQNKIDDLIDWAKAHSKSNDPMHLKWAIKNLEAKLGTPNFGETRIAKLSRYAYLDMEGKRLEAEKMSLVE